MPRSAEFILTLSCPDAKGIVYAVSGLLYQAGCNIIDSQQYGDLDGDDDDGPDFAETRPHEGPGPVEQLDRASDARQLAQCMEGLSAQQRQSVALAFYDGLSHAEVAEHLHQPLGTVKSWVRRALMTLKSCLERAVARDAAAGAAKGA